MSMTEWKEYKLGEIIQIIGGGTPKTSVPEYWDGDIPWLSVSDFNNGKKYVFTTEKHITQLGLNNSSTKLLHKDDIIISARGTVGVVAMIGSDMAFNQSCYGIRNKDLVDKQYLYYLLVNSVNGLKQNAYGGVFDTITRETFDLIDVSLPSLDEQRRIAASLSSLDDKIDLLHRENATLEQMAETLIRQWFVVEAKEEWEEGKLGDILSVKGGTTPSTKEPSFWDGDIAWTSPRDVTTLNGLYLFETEKRITQKGLEQISSGLLPSGTLLMSSRAPVGVLAFAEIPLAINQGYIAILDDKGYSKEFIYLWLKTNMDLVHSYSNGSTFMEISKSAFKSLDISIPSKNEVECFVQEVKPYFEKIRTNEIQIRTLTKTRDGLLPKLMSNEITIRKYGR